MTFSFCCFWISAPVRLDLSQQFFVIQPGFIPYGKTNLSPHCTNTWHCLEKALVCSTIYSYSIKRSGWGKPWRMKNTPNSLIWGFCAVGIINRQAERLVLKICFFFFSFPMLVALHHHCFKCKWLSGWICVNSQPQSLCVHVKNSSNQNSSREAKPLIVPLSSLWQAVLFSCQSAGPLFGTKRELKSLIIFI